MNLHEVSFYYHYIVGGILFAVCILDADGDFAERVDAFGDGVDGELHQGRRDTDNIINCGVGGMYRAGADGGDRV